MANRTKLRAVLMHVLFTNSHTVLKTYKKMDECLSLSYRYNPDPS